MQTNMQINHIINNNNKFTNKDYSNFDHLKILPRHRWYYFKEGFSPLMEIICSGIKKGAKSNLEGYSTFTENSKNNKWLFNRDILRAFEGGWHATEKLPYNIKKLFRLGLLVAVMNNSNAAKDGKCLRYKKDWQNILYSKETFSEDFLKNMAFIHT